MTRHPHWERQIYAMGYEANNNLIALKSYLPYLPPRDPEEMKRQATNRCWIQIYRHLTWLFGNELRMLNDLDAIARNYHEMDP